MKAKESKSFYNTRFFYIYHNPCTHTYTATFFGKIVVDVRNTTDVTEIIATVPLNNASKLRQRQRSMSSERGGGDEGQGAEGMESLEEPLRQSKPSLRRESRQGIGEHQPPQSRREFFADFRPLSNLGARFRTQWTVCDLHCAPSCLLGINQEFFQSNLEFIL